MAEETQRSASRKTEECSLLIKKLASEHAKLVQLVSDTHNAFEKRAFSNFWDSGERVVEQFIVVDSLIGELDRKGKEYQTILKGAKHTFPVLPYDSSCIPSTEANVGKIKTLIEKAQADFEFAMIYEQRCTRQSLVAGHRNIVAALAYVEQQIAAPRVGISTPVYSN